MRTFKNIIIVLIIICCLGYVGQVSKAVRVKQVRLQWSLQEGKITQEQYNHDVREISWVRMLFDPKYVGSVD